MIAGFTVMALLGVFCALLITGAVAGVLAGLLGVGGGIVIVPVLIIIAEIFAIPDDIAMLLVVGTSLATIIPTSMSSAGAHNKKGAIDGALLRGWGPAIFVGALIGGIASKFIGSEGLMLVFGSVALIVSMNFLLPNTITLAKSPPKTPWTKAAVAAPVGFLSALMGIGGGTLSVPLMTMVSVPVHRAVATASVFGLAISVPAVLGFIWGGLGVEGRPWGSVGFVNIPAAVTIISMSVLTAPYGARLAHVLEPRRLRLAFAVFLAISALRMLLKTVG